MVAEVNMMEAKKTQQVAEDTVSVSKKAREFFSDVRAEITKVSWTSKDELIFYTKVVVISTLVLGLSIYGLDLFIQAVLNTLNLVLNFISG